MNRNTNAIVNRNDNVSRFLTDIRQYDVLSIDKQVELLVKYKETGDLKYRDEVISSNLRLLYKEAKCYTKDADVILDIVNEGVKGLTEAVEWFDPTRGFSFITYARHWVHKFMTEYINNKGGVIRNEFVRRCGHKIKKAQESFFKVNYRYPEHNELVDIMLEEYGIDISKYDGLYNFSYLHISDNVAGSDDSNDTYEDTGVFADATSSINGCVDEETKEYNKYIISMGLSSLKERDSDIVQMFFGVGKYNESYTKSDIAEKYNFTVQRIEQIINKSLVTMRSRIKNVA